MKEQKLIELSNVSKTFPGVKALDHVSLEIKKGEVHALVGENGAGKSTLIKILAGVHFPDPGAKIYIEGREARIKSPMDAMDKGISVIYQDISLFPNLSVAENIAIGNKAVWKKKLSPKKMREIAKGALEQVGADIDIEKMLGDLNIASQQIVAIARAVTFNAKLVIMDEPTSSLSRVEITQLYKIIDNLKANKVAVLFISHKLDEIFTVSDRVSVFRDGKYIATENITEISEKELIRLMVGRDVQYLSLLSEKERKVPCFKAQGLSRKGSFKDISFELMRGEILGITGLVGSGRTELAKGIFGIEPLEKGKLVLDGKEILIGNTKDALKAGIGYVPEERHREGLILEEPVYKNMTLPIMGQLKDKRGLLDGHKMKELTKGQIKSLDVRPKDEKMLASQLSGGNQQKVVLGKWILSKPRLLIVDEPTNGVDIGAKIEIHKQLRHLANEGIGIIVISSELPEILALSDRILIMGRGRVKGIIENEAVTGEQIMEIALGADTYGEGA